VQTVGVSADCIFWRIVSGDTPAHVTAEDDLTVAFLDRGQATEGHTLVVPRAHASDIWEISERDATAVMVMAKRIAHLVDECLSPEGLNLIQSNRPAGWQDVFPFHLHVVPRWFGDRLTPPWRRGHSPEEVLAATATRLRSKGQECP
jgi:histidine triad (HIT) family protein